MSFERSLSLLTTVATSPPNASCSADWSWRDICSDRVGLPGLNTPDDAKDIASCRLVVCRFPSSLTNRAKSKRAT